MRLSEVVLGGLIAVVCAGCPGTIEDPTGFEAFQASRRDGGADVDDAGIDAEVPVEDAAVDASEQGMDATTTADAARTEEDASWDAAASDADPGAAEAEAEAGIGCDFPGLMMAKCGGCHDALAVSNGLDLVSPELAQRLAGRRGTGACSSRLLIDVDNPEQSGLYLKVTPDTCGSRMPLGRTLTDGEQACILRWIESLN